MGKTKAQGKEYFAAEIRRRMERWNDLKINGGRDPFWEDGCNMNLVRNHIISLKRQCEAELSPEEYPEEYFWELPPVVDNKYIARPKEIRKHAIESLNVYKADENFRYLKKVVGSLTEKQRNQTCIDNVIGYVVGLKMDIESDDLIAMRRHEYPDRYLDSFSECRKRVEELTATKDQEQELPTGQLSIFDLFGLTILG